MSLNIVIDQKGTELGYSEPISVELAKTFCRITSTNDSIDELFELWIKAAREKIEQVTGLSLVPKSIECQLLNPQGNIELPGGPITDTPVFTDRDGNTLDIQTNGIDFLSISDETEVNFTSWPQATSPRTIGRIDATYEAGYTSDNIPADLKNAILNQVNYWWENRGADSQSAGLSPNVLSSILPYSRKAFIV